MLFQKCVFLPNTSFCEGNNFFWLLKLKSIQKTKNWKFLSIFSIGLSHFKFYYITPHNAPMWNRTKVGIWLFSNFQLLTIVFVSDYQIYNKNAFFWGTLCWHSSKIKLIGLGLKWPFLLIFAILAPLLLFQFLS